MICKCVNIYLRRQLCVQLPQSHPQLLFPAFLFLRKMLMASMAMPKTATATIISAKFIKSSINYSHIITRLLHSYRHTDQSYN